MEIDPKGKCALVVKPVAWSPNGYRGASGPKVVGGFVADYGYGGEEWNNLATRIWKGQRVFHTQSAERLNAYADYGHLAILMIAMKNDTQYIVGLACAVRRNDDDDMAAISRKLKLDAVGESVWAVEAVKKRFKGKAGFLRHWRSGQQTLHWRCPPDLYRWFDEPIPIKKYPLRGDKMVLAKRHSGYQALRPEDGLKLLGAALPEDDSARLWLIENEFDEAILSREERRKPGMSSSQRKTAFSSSAASDPYTRYILARTVRVDPQHDKLEKSFHTALVRLGATELRPNVQGADLIFRHPGKGLCIAELKPAKEGETKYAIRFAVGQVLEYRHFVAAGAAMLVILGAKPNEAELDYLRAIGISCAWEIRKDTFEFSWH